MLALKHIVPELLSGPNVWATFIWPNGPIKSTCTLSPRSAPATLKSSQAAVAVSRNVVTAGPGLQLASFGMVDINDVTRVAAADAGRIEIASRPTRNTCM